MSAAATKTTMAEMADKHPKVNRAWQVSRASAVLTWDVVTIFSGLFYEMAQVGVQLFGSKGASWIKEDVYDNPESNNLSGPMYNGRTGMFDDGGDPQGIYDYDYDLDDI